jgi:hypothetical protein
LAQSLRVGEFAGEWTGQADFAAECREAFLEIGGQELMDFIDNDPPFLQFLDRKADLLRAYNIRPPTGDPGPQ